MAELKKTQAADGSVPQNVDAVTGELLKTVADWEGKFKGAFNIRSNGGCIGRQSSENIKIESKTDNPGLDIKIAPGTKGERVFIPACVTQPGYDDLVYNDFFVGEGADVVIVAGCGIHTTTGEPARHSGIHRFFLEKGARVLYEEKHIGTGAVETEKDIDPQTEAFLEEGAYLEMDTSQLGGVSHTDRHTRAKLGKDATLVIKERLLTDRDETAKTDFEVELNGEGSGVNLMSRSVARGDSHQAYRSVIIGNARCSGHSECDAIIAENGKVDASPELRANDGDAALIHEAAIGKIAGEQIMKLRTLGLTEQEAEQAIINGFLK
ncbi:MAG: SufD family Fe-S cluster assembly protein [Firmicutes bacterium]|nr:SufD family Fe-S cluster assembly protein [Bacillota bacterium]